MHFPPSPRHTLKHYLTLLFCFTLGLAFILVLTACGRKSAVPSGTLQGMPSGSLQTTQPKQFGTQALTKHTPTLLPAIPDTPDVRTPSPLGVTSSQLLGLEVKVWYPWAGDTAASFQVILDDFNRTNKWGITIKSEQFGDFGSLDAAVEASLPSDTLPDVVVDYGYQARRWDQNGILADLTPYVTDNVWGLSRDQQADFYPAFWSEDLNTSDNATKSTRIGIPYYRSAYVLFYNHTWAEEMGFPGPPATPEEFRVQACSAAEALAKSAGKASTGQGGWLITPSSSVLTGWIYAFGGGITTSNGEGYQFNTPQINQAVVYLKGLQESGCAWYDAELDAPSTLANRRALFIVGSLYDIPLQQAAFAQAGSGDEWSVLPFPSNTAPVTVSYGPSLMLMHSTSAKQLASWLVIEWLIYPPNQAKFIQQLGVYPTRQSTLGYLLHTAQAQTQWAQALTLVPVAHGEPNLVSWSVMRWALSDAVAQLFSLKFGNDQLPALVDNLDSIGAEIINQVH